MKVPYKWRVIYRCLSILGCIHRQMLGLIQGSTEKTV